MELIKIKLQTDKGKLNTIRKVAEDIYKTKGLKGFYKGYAVTMNRDLYSYGAYFYVYFGLKGYWERKETLNSMKMFIAGGLSGVVSWMLCFPFDPMKTLIQTTNGEKTMTQKEAYFFIKRNYGINGFFRGVSPVLLKAFLQHGVVFKTTEKCRDFFNYRINKKTLL
jgi:solute carrier family 25 carnitine/acylcarnitine transporter 20/29